MAYQHLLLAIDYSEYSLFVAKKAQDLAASYSAKLSLIHVTDNIPMPQVPYGTEVPLTQHSDEPLLEAEKKKFAKLADQLKIGLEARSLLWGNPKQEISDYAARHDVDLIIVGSHGRHGLALLLGSTANAVLHYAKCDVLAVRLPDTA